MVVADVRHPLNFYFDFFFLLLLIFSGSQYYDINSGTDPVFFEAH